MRFLIIFLAVVFLNKSYCQSCFNAVETFSTYVPCNEQSWVLYFEDNFDDSSLDESKWIYPYQGVVAGYDFDGWKNWYANTGSTPVKPISDNVKIENGMLKIIARREDPPIVGTYVSDWSTTPPTSSSSSFNYSSGWIESKKEFGYGWYEIRCKIPKGRGLWPSFWLFDEHNGIRSEIDIFEFWNEDDCQGIYQPSRLAKNPHLTLHSNRLNPGGNDRQCSYELHGCLGNWGNDGVDFSADYHVFAVEWGYYKINWYIDGQFIYSMYRYNTLNVLGGQSENVGCNTSETGKNYLLNDSWPFSDRMQVRFNMALQSVSKNGNVGTPDISTPFPSSFEIDYFRYYKQAPCSINKIITSKSQLNLSSVLYNTLMGENVTVSTSVIINGNEQLEVVGSNEVVLDPGFEAADDAIFVAHIDPGYCNISQIAVGNGVVEAHQMEYNISEPLLGTEINTETEIFKIYPNPVNAYLSIEFPEVWTEADLIEICDLQGKVLFQSEKKSNEQKMDLDVSYLSNGMYVLKISDLKSGKFNLTRFLKRE